MPQVEGAQIQNDPNHPVEIYYGLPSLHDLALMEYNLNLTVYPEDKVVAIPSPELGIGSKITVWRATPVEIIDAKKSKIYRTWAGTVKELLGENNIKLLGKDSVLPSLNHEITYNMKIKITRVDDVEVTEKQPIDYKSIKKYSVDLEKGQSKVQTRGINGEKQVVVKIHRVDGVDTSKTVIATKIIKEAQNEILIVGIGPRLAKSGPYKDTVNAAAKSYLINGTALMCLMIEESNGHADSVNPDGPYYGLFQYSETFWNLASSRAGYGGASWSNPTAQIYTTAWALTHGYGSRWGGTWPYCKNK